MADATTLAVQAIEDRIRDNIADFDLITLDRVAWQGMDFQPGEEDWMRPVTLWAESDWFTDGVTGTGVNVVPGILTVSFYTPPGYGFSALDAYASAWRALFDRVLIAVTGHGGVQFGPAGGPRPGPPDSGWISNIIDTPFHIEEHGS